MSVLAQASKPTVVVHFEEGSGFPVYYVFGEPVRLFVVDDNCKSDRVYEILHRDEPDKLAELLGDDTIGNQHDARHPAIVASIDEMLTGKPRLTLVPTPEPDHDR